eukprot:scaffold36239_cov78-Attheya_sp.AAC.2
MAKVIQNIIPEDCCVPVHKVSTNSTLRWIKPVLTIMKIKEERTEKLMRFETDIDLVCLCGIMGETVTGNVRTQPPPKTQKKELKTDS